MYSDGGGKHRAALRAVVGRSNIIKFIRGVRSEAPLAPMSDSSKPTASPPRSWQWTIVAPNSSTVEVRDHRINAIFGISNPDKLSYLDHQLANRG